MKTFLISLFLFSILLLQGCIQAPSNSRKASLASSSTATGTNTTPTVYPTFATDELLYWFTTTKITSTVTINKDSQDIIYLRGKNVHDFLNAKDITGVEYYRKQYCMVGNFAAGTPTKKQLRVRAVPIYVRTSTNAIERLLRVDIPSDADNTTACNFSTIDTIIPGASAFSIATICPTCTGLATTTNLSLYEAKTSSLASISSSLLNFSSIFLKTDFTSNSTSPSNSCTNTSCSAQGFDCCISGQCVKDASEKTNASIDPQYAQAKSDYATNPLSFINYPNIYYICTNIAHTPPTSSGTTTTPMSAAQLRVFQYASDWKCINDYTASGANVYYVHKINNTFVSSLTGLVAASYNTVNCDASFYAITKKKLAVSCGCTASDSEMAVKCPDWGVVPVYNAGAAQTMANITDFNCYTPLPENPIGPITNLNVSVPNRSSPHRFYTTAGVNFDSLTGLQASSPTTTQEGTDFHYLDEYNKAGPVNGSFNINSVIGKMTVDLSHALPAKMVNVELGKAYIFSSTSGYFTPCSRCAKDSWFQTFTANPITQRGVGLQASGYTTSRDTYAGNTTFGNYEDTKFGRACYVPVTMLPLSHQKNANLQTQRQNRLTTQAAQYINGYQRDWYGFNKGALIGSFDGVTWFAIGTGRRATATSTKLYLALNASFLDLADMTDTIVNIIPDFSANTAADYDYDPDLSLTDSHQNAAATCQKFHQCSVDADCVSQLGWEYTCSDVSQYKTKWPLFDSEAKEVANQERYGSLFEILQSTISTSNGKRCVYRGAGAPCKRIYSAGTNEYTQKSLTCAPNFYCASLTTNKFNDELVRSPNELDNILFGMDANILGRPLNYVTANKYLSTEIVSNIKYNSALNTNDPDDMGICRPGKALSSNAVTAHITADTAKRTDYISQIGSCDATATSTNRFVSCPAFDDTLNYVSPAALDLNEQKQTQNSCGAEAKHTTTFLSAFKSIEGLSLLTPTNLGQPTLVQDACYRRAGSICHTDLDCGPNKMHEDVVGTIDIKYFGGTEGEQSYWRESLVCSQGTPAPTLGTAGYLDYKLNENRCCREIGKDFTMVTQGPASIVPENVGTNINLIADKFAFLDPKAANRYSRYSISKELITETTTVPKVSTTAEPVAKQWKVINETGALTCCGGGYIRKFADGTHDWKVKNRFNLDAANFSCLNFRSPLADANYANSANFTSDKIVPASYARESEYFCKSPTDKGCLQIDYLPNSAFAIYSPRAYDPALAIAADPNNGVALSQPPSGYTRIDTSPSADPSGAAWTQKLNSDVPYTPIPYRYSDITIDGDSDNNWAAFNFFTDKDFDYGVEMYLPAYVGYDGTLTNPTFISAVYIKYFYGTPLLPVVVAATSAPAGECLSVITTPTTPTPVPVDRITGVNKWCITTDPLTQNRPVINVKANSAGTWKYAGIIIDFKPVEQNRGTKVTEPGNALYYLSKLAKLELLGIPQITYEPLYCNNNKDNLVPGIFKTTTAAPLQTRTQFTTNSLPYSGTNPILRYNDDGSTNTIDVTGAGGNYGNYEKRFTYQNKIDHPAVFSSKDFACCVPLGKTTTSAAKCCTGFAVGSICKLPKGTDLNVYFNKLVSNEGVGETQPGGGLTITGTDEEIDFNPYTGEPKYRGSTYDKLVALGNSYCDGGTVVTGGAFGEFPPEPFSGSYTVQAGATGNIADSFPASIVDSVIDFKQSDPNLGKVPFDSGFKWNHHYYCK
jgi:hypothetical protein